MSRVWIDQDSRQKAKHGVKAKWMIYWYEGARKRSRTIGSKSLAEKAPKKRGRARSRNHRPTTHQVGDAHGMLPHTGSDA